MLLFRALSSLDNLSINEGIYCSLYHTYLELYNSKISNKEFGKKEYRKLSKKEKDIYNYFAAIFRNNSKVSSSLDTIIGHVSGQKLNAGTSPWISTSTDFYYVAREYSIKQAGGFNNEDKRKNIAFISYDDSDIYDSIKKIREIRDKINNFNFAIDLRNNKLDEYYKDGAVSAIAFNLDLPDPDIVKIINKELFGCDPYLTGFPGYATNASEIVINKKIESDKISLVINPLLIDILYSFTNNIDYHRIKRNYDNIKQLLSDLLKNSGLLKELYPNISEGINLTDYLVDNYSSILGKDIEEKYEHLKVLKYNLLKEFAIQIEKYNLFEITYTNRFIDSEVNVNNYETLINKRRIMKKEKFDKYLYDLLVIEKDKELYKYDNNLKCYTSNDKKLVLKK